MGHRKGPVPPVWNLSALLLLGLYGCFLTQAGLIKSLTAGDRFNL